ncbi:hypothetical protein BD779DRAFT_1483092 [Infundibulicybe gibba]|nr:hypothetical protein BD779DRAFT_1483092 [Infundibulicybe gibba]
MFAHIRSRWAHPLHRSQDHTPRLMLPAYGRLQLSGKALGAAARLGWIATSPRILLLASTPPPVECCPPILTPAGRDGLWSDSACRIQVITATSARPSCLTTTTDTWTPPGIPNNHTQCQAQLPPLCNVRDGLITPSAPGINDIITGGYTHCNDVDTQRLRVGERSTSIQFYIH